MYVTTTEFIKNMDHYFTLLHSEYVYVTSNGEVVTVLTSSETNRVKIAKSLIGFVPAVDDAVIERMKEERISKL